MTIATQPPSAATTLQGRVLVVDDDASLVETLCAILSLAGVDAAGVGSAGEATTWCNLHSPDLVVLDQRLPDSSGLRLAAQLKERDPLLPVVLLTGYASTDSAVEAVGLVDEYLTKPVPPHELLKVVQTRLEQHRLRVANQALLAQLQEANNRLELTVHERTRELLAARDEAMEASRLKSQFLANMSHELRTPMNGVIGATELMARTPLSDEQSAYVEILTSSGRSLLAVINDVLDFSKIEADRLDLHAAPFDLTGLFAEVVTVLSAQASAKGLRLTVDVRPGLPDAVVGDAVRLRQVVTNLAGNAVKFTDAGEVSIRVSVDSRSEDQVTIRCSVTDSGIGIAEKDVPLLFQVFSQVDSSDTRRFGGTGLGLAISDRLVRLMGGEIGCEPNPDGGSIFWFTVPFAVPAAPPTAHVATQARAADRPGPPSRRSAAEAPLVLVVEDDETNIVVMQRMLKALGYRCDTVRTGSDAIRQATAARYAAILMDCQMAGMDGYTTTERIRATPVGENGRVPIIAVTATATTEDKERCLAVGMDDYLTKPIMMDRLTQVLHQWAPAQVSRAAPSPAG
ncbi:MAG: response regulator [Actinomycetales bacterium]